MSNRKIKRANHVYLTLYNKWKRVTHQTAFAKRESMIFTRLLKAAGRVDKLSPMINDSLATV